MYSARLKNFRDPSATASGAESLSLGVSWLVAGGVWAAAGGAWVVAASADVVIALRSQSRRFIFLNLSQPRGVLYYTE